MDFFIVFGFTGLAILTLMTALWAASLSLKNTSIVDIFWGAGFMMVNRPRPSSPDFRAIKKTKRSEP